jgi:hypothetical protein
MKKNKITRYILEGTWSGYTSGQSHVAHREAITPKKAEKLKGVRGIRYTDGTYLWLDVRPALPYEKVSPINGYNKLIDECIRKGVYDVAQL